MPTKPQKPNLLIIPGSLTYACMYNGMIAGLKTAGFNDTFIYTLPSSSRRPPDAAATLAEDVMFFNGVLTALCKAGKDVVVLGHSYGGAVASGCVQGLTEKREDGKGRVVGLIYWSAMVPKAGQQVMQLYEELTFDCTALEGDYLYMGDPEGCARAMFNDLPLEEGVALVKQMPYHSALSFGSPLPWAAYRDVDRIAYILCTRDKCLPPDFQRRMIWNLKENGRPVQVYEFESDHFGSASHLRELVDLVGQIVEEQFM